VWPLVNPRGSRPPKTLEKVAILDSRTVRSAISLQDLRGSTRATGFGWTPAIANYGFSREDAQRIPPSLCGSGAA
jgi:hypothetical protein